MKKHLLSILLVLLAATSYGQEFLSIKELTERREHVEMEFNTAEAIFIAATNDLAITTSNRSVDMVASPVKRKDGTYEYVVILDISNGHNDRHFTVEKQGTTFRAVTQRKSLFAEGDRRYYYVEEPKVKFMLTQPENKTHLVKEEACVEFFSPYPDLRVDTSGLLNVRITSTVSEGGAFVTSVLINTVYLDRLRDEYQESQPDYWEDLTTLSVRFDSSNASSVSVADLQQRVKHRYNIVPVSGGGSKGSDNLRLLSVAFSPTEAVVRLDGELLPSVHGQADAFVEPGIHRYDIECPYYHSISDTIRIGNDQRSLNVRLTPAFGYLKVTGQGVRGATVLVNGKEVGTAPYSSDRMLSGNYTVELVRDLYLPYKEEIQISDGQTYEISTNLVADYAHVTFKVGIDADIYINDTLRGHGQYIADMRTGTYVVEAHKEGYTTTVDSIRITPKMMDRTFVLKTPSPIYGLLAIRTRPAKAMVWNKDSLLCRTPCIVRTLVGGHDLTMVKNGRDTVYASADVSQRRCLEVKAKLPRASLHIPDSCHVVKMKYVRHPVAYQRGTLLIFHVNYAWEPQLLAYGISIGSLRRCGWTLNLNSNFKFNGLDSKRTPYGSVPIDSNVTRFTATLGLVIRTCNVLSLRVGGGIGYYAKNYKMANRKWYPNMDSRIFGPQLDAGFAIHLNPLMITFEYSTTYFRYHEGRIGLGFCIQKRLSATSNKKTYK